MKHVVFLIGCIFVLLLAGQLCAYSVLFRAFHDDLPPSPDARVEDPEEWNANSVTPGNNVFAEEDGRLQQTANECPPSVTKTFLPVVDGANWTDYTVSMDVWWKDDDGVSIIFRYTDEEHYYSFTVGGTDPIYANNYFLGPTNFPETTCFGLGGEKANLLGQGPNGQAVSNAGPFTMMVRVEDSKIECFFGEQISPDEIMAGKTPPKMCEAEDDRFESGGVAIGTSSCPSEFGNIMVLAGEGKAVDANGKLATTWADIRNQ